MSSIRHHIRPACQTFILVAASLCLLYPPSAPAGELAVGKTPPPPPEPEKEEPWITPKLDMRGRYEYGDEDGRNSSNAWTLRTRAGLLSKKIYGFQAYAEYEGTLVADRDGYQAASVHGLGQNKTIIADPQSHELNQLWLSYGGIEQLEAKAGRQAINLDNQRYVGTVAWRQNMQTFDAAALTISPVEDVHVFYSYVNRVNRIFGSGDIHNPAQTDFEGNTHLVNIAFPEFPIGKLVAFAYFMDLGNDAGNINSNNSFGANLSGPLFNDALTYYAEYGYQTDAFDNPQNYGAHYLHANLSAPIAEKNKLTVGYERLGSDNGVGYRFPLATLHKFNGFADRFLITPVDGLQDIYVSFATKLPLDFGLALIYHKFYNDDGGANFGSEYDAVLTKSLGHGLTFLTKFAYYDGNDDRYATLKRVTAQIEFKF